VDRGPGVVLGYFVMGTISDGTARIIIGAIIVSLCALGVLAKVPGQPIAGNGRNLALVPSRQRSASSPASITVVANAAGPLMSILPGCHAPAENAVRGHRVRVFHGAHRSKAPFMVKLGLITPQSFEFNLALAPAVFLGALAGRWLLIRHQSAAVSRISCWA